MKGRKYYNYDIWLINLSYCDHENIERGHFDNYC